MKNFDTAWMVSEMVEKLRKGIQKDVKKGFKEIHLSGNLMKTTWSEDIVRQYWTSYLEKDFSKPTKVAVIHIPAVRYDIKKYRDEGVIEHHPELGSYAQEVDVMGGFSGYHKMYVEDAIINNILKAYNGAKYGLGKTSKFKLFSIVVK